MELIDEYAGNHPQFPEHNWHISHEQTALWSIIFLLLILLTLLYIQVKKGEMFLKIICGESRSLLVAREAGIDLLCIVGGALLIQYLLRGYTESYFCSAVFYRAAVVYALADTLLYLSFARYRSKRVYGNRRLTGAAMPLLYALKAASMALVALVLTSNVLLAEEAVSFLSQEDFFAEHRDYYYTNICYLWRGENNGQAPADTENDFRIKEIFYRKNYRTFQPILLAEFGQWRGRDMIYANGYALDYLQEVIPDLRASSPEQRCYYILPEALSGNPDIVSYLDLRLENYLPEETLKDRALICYPGKTKVINIDELSPLISRVSRTPIIILDNREIDFVESEITGNVFFTTLDQSIMYRLNDAEFDRFIADYGLEADIHGKSNVYEVYLRGRLMMRRVLKMALVLAGFFTLLEILILQTVTKMEFRFHAYQISLQKILGYTRRERYARLFLLSLISAVAAEIIFLITDIVYALYPLWQGTLVIGLVFVLELLLMDREISKLEKRSIPLVLKGEFR